MTIGMLTPDVALAALLDGKVEVHTSARAKHTVRCYADGKQPNVDLGKEYLTVQWNGAARTRSTRMGIYQGSIVLTIYCEMQPDNTVRTQIVRQILEQCGRLIHRKEKDGIFFTFNPANVIMPTTANLTTRYSATALNVEWRTIANEG